MPAHDVTALAQLLASETHGPYSVTLLVDASYSQALEAIYEVLINQAGKDDLVLLYYSGHGKLDQDGNLYLASRDTRTKFLPITSIPLSTIGPWMKQSRSRKIVLILDYCYSGAVERIFSRGETSEQIAQSLPKQLNGRGTYVLTASTDVQLAEEKEGDEHGLLTKHILAGIREGAADRDDDGMVSMNELLTYVQEKVTAEGAQSPQGYALQLEGGNLEIAKTGRVARYRRHEELRDAIYSVGQSHSIPFRVMSAVCAAVEPVTGLSPEAQHRYDDQFEHLYRYRRDRGALVAEIYKIASSVQQEAYEREAHRWETHPQLNASVWTETRVNPDQAGANSIHLSSNRDEATTTLRQANAHRDQRKWRQAIPFYEKAAAAGHADAMTNLDDLYKEGHGVKQNYITARKWYEKAAAVGQAAAMTNLGVLYNKGLGVEQNYTTAKGWYEKAAAAGHAVAMTNLGVYSTRATVPRTTTPPRRSGMRRQQRRGMQAG